MSRASSDHPAQRRPGRAPPGSGRSARAPRPPRRRGRSGERRGDDLVEVDALQHRGDDPVEVDPVQHQGDQPLDVHLASCAASTAPGRTVEVQEPRATHRVRAVPLPALDEDLDAVPGLEPPGDQRGPRGEGDQRPGDPRPGDRDPAGQPRRTPRRADQQVGGVHQRRRVPPRAGRGRGLAGGPQRHAEADRQQTERDLDGLRDRAPGRPVASGRARGPTTITVGSGPGAGMGIPSLSDPRSRRAGSRRITPRG